MKALLGLFQRTCGVLNFIGAIGIVAIMVLILLDVGGRAAFNRPLLGVPEIVKLSIVAIAWLQMAYTLRIGGHLRTTVLIDRLPPLFARAAEAIAAILGVVVFVAIAYSEWPNVVSAWRIGEFEGDAPMRIPTAPVHTVVFVGALLTAVQFLLFVLEAVGLKRAEARLSQPVLE